MNEPIKFNITGAGLRGVCPSLTLERAANLASLMNKIFPVYAITSKDIAEEFVAQLAHESIEFSAKTENLNYSSEAILRTWPTRFKTLKDTLPYTRNPKALANKVYNGRMGNKTGTDDGWNFRGAGFLQNTGKDSILPYYSFKKKGKGFPMSEKIESPEDVVGLLRTNDVWALDAACYEFAVSKALIDEAINDDFLKITKAINGGTIGMPSRLVYYERAKKYL